MSARPTLLHLRTGTAHLPAFVRGHLADQRRCLEQWFRVVVVEGDADYAALVDRHEPALALLESGVYTAPRTITGLAARPEVPRLGFLHADAYCPTRARAIADFDHWEVEQVLTTSVSMAAYTPALAERLVVWPNFVVPSGDDPLPPAGRPVPVLMTGSHAAHYPWRVAVARELEQAGIATRRTPHAGWFDRAADARMVSGAAYVAELESSQVVPACGSIARDLVRKHLEVPAAGALLVAEPSAALAAAGFRDGVNCVLAEPREAVRRTRDLLEEPDELARLAAAGRALVLERHTAAQRDQVRQWHDLRRQHPGARIGHRGPFLPLEVGTQAPTLAADGRDRILLAEAGELRRGGRVAEAEVRALRAANLHPAIEPLAELARCRLAVGRAASAADVAARGVEMSTSIGGEPDPGMLALLVRAETAAHRPDRAARLAAAYPADPRRRASLVPVDPGEGRPFRIHRGPAGPVPALRPRYRRLRLRWRSRLRTLLWRTGALETELAGLLARTQPTRVVVVAPSRRGRACVALTQVVAASTSVDEVWWSNGSGRSAARLRFGVHESTWEPGVAP
ncbi:MULTISPECIES: glycosyltransferase [unclassified Nocardioides]|uniref:glycosyltransferase n=1 Tax=unclassified Nocardioides TaxID=2615069 RepID=UPI003014481D